MVNATPDEMIGWLNGPGDAYLDRGCSSAVVVALQRLTAMEASIRAIELRVDGLNTKALPQKKTTQDALDGIKAICRATLTETQR